RFELARVSPYAPQTYVSTRFHHPGTRAASSLSVESKSTSRTHLPCGRAGAGCVPLGVACAAPEGAAPLGAGAPVVPGAGRAPAPAAGAPPSGLARLAASCTRLRRAVTALDIMARPSELTKKSAPSTTVALLKKVAAPRPPKMAWPPPAP